MSPPLDLLILGAGWTATFLIPQLRSANLTFAATTRDGRDVAGSPTLAWTLDTSSTSPSNYTQFSPLPAARVVLITFPLTSAAQSALVAHGYRSTHSATTTSAAHFIQLGSTGIWQKNGPTVAPASAKFTWTTRHSAYDSSSPRAIAEDALLTEFGGTVLNLAGLWDDEARNPRKWVARVGGSRDAVAAKKSVHLVHGVDVGRGIVGVVKAVVGGGKGVVEKVRRQRYMLTDGFVYDWWALMAGWAEEGEQEGPSQQARWVAELMRETETRALPRSMSELGRCYDSREFWETFDVVPLRARV